MNTFLQFKRTIARILFRIGRAATSPGRYLRRRQVQIAGHSGATNSVYWKAIDSHMLMDPNTFFAEAYVQGVYEPALVHYMKRSIRPGMICVDVGANVGYFTLLMAKLTQSDGSVVAFEPTKRVFNLLKHNVEVNRLENVALEHLALSDQDGSIEFHEGPAGFEVYNSLGHITHPSAVRQSFVATTVDCLRFETYAAQHGLVHVDFVKIDVEGAELSVLSGLEKSLDLNPQIRLVIEFADETTRGFGYSAKEIGYWLVNRGFHLYMIGKRGALEPVMAVEREWHGQIIVASRQILLS